VTRRVKLLIDSDSDLADLWVQGEVSNFTRASSGHCYFTLKDQDSELRCVMWRSLASRLSWQPHQGDSVYAHGKVSVYERGGAYQFYADLLQQSGIGLRWQQFLELKERLEGEGLFDPDIKRPLPERPKRIGVVTSPTGAALRDILRVLQERYPLVDVVLSPSMVQGETAPASLVQAIRHLDAMSDLDVIIVARGGGSIEDLWAFNSEEVARAVRATHVPVVSGVGHETDLTIIDFVADQRTPTPSAAAAAVVPDIWEIRDQILAMMQRAMDLITARLDTLDSRLTQTKQRLDYFDPLANIATSRQHVSGLVDRGATLIKQRLLLSRTRVEGQRRRLAALNPKLVLERGYAVVQDLATGTRIVSTSQTRQAQTLRIHLHDGHLDTQVNDISGVNE